MSPLLAVEDLAVSFPGAEGRLEVLRRISFSVEKGEILGLVGESGSGKSMTALAILGLLPPTGSLDSGSVRLDGRELVGLEEKEMCRVRGGGIGLVFQEPMTALNPVFTVGDQIAEAARLHRAMRRREARAEAVRLLELVAVPDAASRARDYPHQLSGGQRQRALIAMALAAEPRLLLADEPTTALDVTVQAQILELLEDLRQRLGLAIVLITHDLGVVAETCDRVLVMYAGEIVEEAPVAPLFESPAHPYTQALLAASPCLGRPAPRGALPTVPGRVPNPGEIPAGCAFEPRCDQVFAPCAASHPALYYAGEGARRARCFLHREVAS